MQPATQTIEAANHVPSADYFEASFPFHYMQTSACFHCPQPELKLLASQYPDFAGPVLPAGPVSPVGSLGE